MSSLAGRSSAIEQEMLLAKLDSLGPGDSITLNPYSLLEMQDVRVVMVFDNEHHGAFYGQFCGETGRGKLLFRDVVTSLSEHLDNSLIMDRLHSNLEPVRIIPEDRVVSIGLLSQKEMREYSPFAERHQSRVERLWVINWISIELRKVAETTRPL